MRSILSLNRSVDVSKWAVMCLLLCCAAYYSGVAYAADTPAQTRTYRIAYMGDSLSVGLGLPKGHSMPQKLQDYLLRKGYAVQIDNFTKNRLGTRVAYTRMLKPMLETRPDLVILALGADDYLRNLPPHKIREYLNRIVRDIWESGTPVLLIGMPALKAKHPEYVELFYRMYQDLVTYYRMPYYNNLLAGVLGREGVTQKDEIHPNAEGMAVMVQQLSPYVERILLEMIKQGR